MKRFQCADVVPGCDAVVRGATTDEVVAQACAHLVGMHGHEDHPALRDRTESLVRNGGVLDTLLRRR